MQVYVHGKNFVISDQVRDYIEKKIGSLDRYLPDLNDARVEITREGTKSNKDRHIVQATLRANGTILRAEERTRAVYVGIDSVADKIQRQIVRYKGKREDRWHGQSHVYAHPKDGEPLLDPETLAALAEESERQVVRRKRFLLTPMNEDEAIEQMNLLDHDFFVFFNADSGRINVLYRRQDQDYGLIDPEIA